MRLLLLLIIISIILMLLLSVIIIIHLLEGLNMLLQVGYQSLASHIPLLLEHHTKVSNHAFHAYM